MIIDTGDERQTPTGIQKMHTMTAAVIRTISNAVTAPKANLVPVPTSSDGLGVADGLAVATLSKALTRAPREANKQALRNAKKLFSRGR